MENSFSIKYHLTLLEYYKCSLYFGIRNKKLRLIFYLIPGVFFLSLIASIFLGPKEVSYNSSFFLQLLLPPLFLLVFFLGGIFILCFLVQLLKSNYFKNVTYEFTHWGMFKNGKEFEYSSPWNKILKRKETKSYFFLYVNENEAHIVQKRMFLNDGEINAFRSMLEEKIGLFN